MSIFFLFLSLFRVAPDETDTFLGQVNNPSFLNVGDSYNNSLTVTLPQGIDNDYFFIVKTDATNRVFELDKEDDNENFGGPTKVMLTPPPDLQVTNLMSVDGQLFERGDHEVALRDRQLKN